MRTEVPHFRLFAQPHNFLFRMAAGAKGRSSGPYMAIAEICTGTIFPWRDGAGPATKGRKEEEKKFRTSKGHQNL